VQEILTWGSSSLLCRCSLQFTEGWQNKGTAAPDKIFASQTPKYLHSALIGERGKTARMPTATGAGPKRRGATSLLCVRCDNYGPQFERARAIGLAMAVRARPTHGVKGGIRRRWDVSRKIDVFAECGKPRERESGNRCGVIIFPARPAHSTFVYAQTGDSKSRSRDRKINCCVRGRRENPRNEVLYCDTNAFAVLILLFLLNFIRTSIKTYVRYFC